MEFKDILNSEKEFRYQLLGRMQSDCEYYLGYGCRNAVRLWAGDEKKQIEYIKALWNSFREGEKPEWLSFEKILEYEKEMVGKENKREPHLSITDYSAEYKTLLNNRPVGSLKPSNLDKKLDTAKGRVEQRTMVGEKKELLR